MVKQPRWMAWYGTLQVSPHPRLRWDTYYGSAEEMKRGAVSAMDDKRRWDEKNPGKLAEVRECKEVEDGSPKV